MGALRRSEGASVSITAVTPNDRVRLDPVVREIAKRWARQNERSLAAEIRYGYTQYLISSGLYAPEDDDAPNDR